MDKNDPKTFNIGFSEKGRKNFFSDDSLDDVDFMRKVEVNERNEQIDGESYESHEQRSKFFINKMPEEAGEKKNKRSSKLFKPLIAVLIIGFCIFAVADIIVQQNEIEQLTQETQTITGKIEEAKQLNDEYEAMMRADEEEFMQRIAVEQLGYSYPNEKRFYIVNNAEN